MTKPLEASVLNLDGLCEMYREHCSRNPLQSLGLPSNVLGVNILEPWKVMSTLMRSIYLLLAKVFGYLCLQNSATYTT